MRRFLIVGVAALAITACSKKGADADGDGKISGKEAAAEMASGGKLAMKPGQWEIKMTNTDVDIPGVPEAAKAQIKAQLAKGITASSCLKQEDVDKPGGNFFGADANSDCKFGKLDRSGNKISVEMTCKMQGLTMHSTSEGEFGEESYKLNMSQKIEMPTGTMTSKGTLEGRRTGDCKA